MVYDVIIIGSGPAGLTAAIYTTRADLKTLVVSGVKWGGQLMLTTEVENFPGFPEGIQGPDLMQNMRKQAERFGTEFVNDDFTSADFSSRPFKVSVGGKTYESKSVIIATGADTKWLGVPGEAEKIGRGVSSCAPCDAAFFRNKNVIVVGGGDSAMEEALVLTKFATSVTLIHRKDSFKASEIMQKRVKENPKIKIQFNSEVVEVLGESKVEKVKIKNNKTGEVSEMPIDGVFVAIGHIPNTKLFKDIEVDGAGFIKARDHYLTNIDGVFVAGDVHDSHYKQAVTAAGYGCAAALEAQKWLREQES
ncbi:MAG: thioredoxin-disulfide reductase [Patescibacteria group bacterium]|nr:thioredoxin-disulfide reductase [Patescibacteria group bacterium]